MPNESPTLLSGYHLRPRAEQGPGLCLLQKGFDKYISPASCSSCIKQTVILCYGLFAQEALILHQVKSHDVGAFAASEAFQSGISLEQLSLSLQIPQHPHTVLLEGCGLG